MNSHTTSNHSAVVSIIIPAFNVGDYIEDCIDSLVNQTYKNIHIIIIDDGSTDSTQQIAHSYAIRDQRVQVIRQNNSGAASARNIGLKVAKGDFIMFVDADDILTSNTIEDNLVFLLENDKIDWVSFPIRRMRKDGSPLILDKSFMGFFPKENKLLFQSDFIPMYFSGALSELCCGSIFRHASVRDIYFPIGEYYEDSFYFTDIIAITRCGMLSIHGEYQYIERDCSSQHAVLSYKRLHSKMNSLLYRIERFANIAPQFFDLYRNMENKLYEFFIYQKIKKNPFAETIMAEFINRIGYVPHISLRKQLKHMVFKLLGYNRLKSIYNFFSK